jgi:hypothetical protein
MMRDDVKRCEWPVNESLKSMMREKTGSDDAYQALVRYFEITAHDVHLDNEKYAAETGGENDMTLGDYMLPVISEEEHFWSVCWLKEIEGEDEEGCLVVHCNEVVGGGYAGEYRIWLDTMCIDDVEGECMWDSRTEEVA